MVGIHQSLNSSRDLTTPLLWMICHPWAIALATINPPTKFKLSISTDYEDIKGDTKYRKWASLA